MNPVQESDDHTDDQNSNNSECKEGKLRTTIGTIIRGATFVSGVVRPIVTNLAKTYTRLGPLDSVVSSVDAGLQEAKEHINKETGEEHGSPKAAEK